MTCLLCVDWALVNPFLQHTWRHVMLFQDGTVNKVG